MPQHKVYVRCVYVFIYVYRYILIFYIYIYIYVWKKKIYRFKNVYVCVCLCIHGIRHALEATGFLVIHINTSVRVHVAHEDHDTSLSLYFVGVDTIISCGFSPVFARAGRVMDAMLSVFVIGFVAFLLSFLHLPIQLCICLIIYRTCTCLCFYLPVSRSLSLSLCFPPPIFCHHPRFVVFRFLWCLRTILTCFVLATKTLFSRGFVRTVIERTTRPFGAHRPGLQKHLRHKICCEGTLAHGRLIWQQQTEWGPGPCQIQNMTRMRLK